MSTTTYNDPALAGTAIARDRARELLGQVMGYVAATVGFAALGAYLGRDLGGGAGLLLFIPALAAIFGLNAAAAAGRDQLAIARLFALGLGRGGHRADGRSFGTSRVLANAAAASRCSRPLRIVASRPLGVSANLYPCRPSVPRASEATLAPAPALDGCGATRGGR